MSAFGVSLLVLIAYTYVGYPLLLALWAWLAPRRVASRDDLEPSVSVCIAVSNGGRYIGPKLESLLALDYPHDQLEILVYDDGSTDDTRRIALEYAAADPHIRVLANPVRTGKPTALNQLAAAAHGEVLLMTDVRQRLAPSALRALLRPLADQTIGCVSGNLVLSGPGGAGAYWRYERLIREREGRLGAMVGVSGSVYAVRRAELPQLPPDLILDDMYVPLRIALTGKHVVFARDAEAYDETANDDREFNRKVRTLAGNFQLLAKLPQLLVPWRNPVWFQLFSHKFLRLACPWALVALVFVSMIAVVAPGSGMRGGEIGFWRLLAVGQAAFYVLAAIGSHAGRFASLARTFVVLNAAAVVGLWRFVRRSQAVTW